MSRIAFVSTMRGTAWGGSEELWSQTALRLQKAGHDVSASVLRWPNRPGRVAELEKAGVEISWRARKPGLLGRLRRKLKQGSLSTFESNWLQRRRPEILLISQGGPWDGLPWMLAARELGLSYCGLIQANGETFWPTDEQLQMALRAVEKVRKLFFVSESNRRLMEMQLGIRLERAEIVANPLAVRRTDELSWPQQNGHAVMACVGRLDPAAKGQDLLLQVLAQEKWRKRPLLVNFYGRGRSEESLRRMAALLGLENVRFRGHVRDVQAIWATNQALVLPSRFEGLPLAMLEAMLCGRPVIATDVAGSREVIREGQNGFMAAAPTPKLLDEAMEKAWARRADWQSLGEAARADALRYFPADPAEKFSARLLTLV